jgi:HAMP domain-containing protein
MAKILAALGVAIVCFLAVCLMTYWNRLDRRSRKKGRGL